MVEEGLVEQVIFRGLRCAAFWDIVVRTERMQSLLNGHEQNGLSIVRSE